MVDLLASLSYDPAAAAKERAGGVFARSADDPWAAVSRPAAALKR